MRDHHKAISELGAQVICVGTGDLPYAKEFKAKYQLPFRILVDDDVKTYELIDAGRGSQLNWATPTVIKASALALASTGAFHGKPGKHMDFLGATHIISPDGFVPFAWRNRDFHDDAPMDEVLQALREAQ